MGNRRTRLFWQGIWRWFHKSTFPQTWTAIRWKGDWSWMRAVIRRLSSTSWQLFYPFHWCCCWHCCVLYLILQSLLGTLHFLPPAGCAYQILPTFWPFQVSELRNRIINLTNTKFCDYWKVKLTLRLESFVLPFEIINVLLMRRILPPHELNVIGRLLQNLGPASLKTRATILQIS